MLANGIGNVLSLDYFLLGPSLLRPRLDGYMQPMQHGQIIPASCPYSV